MKYKKGGPKPSQVRRRVETRAKNIMFLKAVQEAKDRQTLKTEQARVHSLLHESIAPALRDRLKDRDKVIGKMIV